MIRKTLIALTATVAVGAAVLTPTAASAWHHHHHGHGFHGWRGLASALRLLLRLLRLLLPVSLCRDPPRSAPHPGEHLRVLSRGCIG